LAPVTFAPGQTCQAVTVPSTGDDAAGATPRTSFKVAVSYSSNAVLGSNDLGALVIREDDGVTGTATSAPPVGAQGDVCAEHAALAKPGTLAVNVSKPAPGQTVTITGHGYRVGESVAVTIGSSPVGSAIAGSTGAVSLNAVIPTDAASTRVTIIAVGAGSGYSSTTSVKVRTAG